MFAVSLYFLFKVTLNFGYLFHIYGMMCIDSHYEDFKGRFIQ
jgi:hypothetical protein